MAKKTSEFLAAIFENLNERNIQYCVERNYENYPDIITGDVDILVLEKDMQQIVDLTCRVAEKEHWKPYIRYITHQASHIGFFTDSFPDRFVLVIEFFSGGVWRGMPFLKDDRAIQFRKKHGVLWKLDPSHEAMISLFHHLLYNGTVYGKYRYSIKALFDESPICFKNEVALKFGNKISTKISNLISSENWSELEQLSKILRIKLISRSMIFSFIETTKSLFYLYKGLLKKQQGLFISYLDSTSSELRIPNAIIELANKWHIFIPPNRLIINAQSANYKYKINKVIKSGGIIILQSSFNRVDIDSYLKRSGYKRPLIVITKIDDQFKLQINNETFVFQNENDEIVSMKLWSCILKYLTR